MSSTDDSGQLSHLVRALAYEVLVVIVTAVLITVGAFALLQGRFEDLYLRIRGPAPVSGDVALVTIGDEALYLWDPARPAPDVTPRPLLAEVVGFLDAAGAKVVVLDLLLDRPAAGDADLVKAARAHGAVLGAVRFVPGHDGAFAPDISPSLEDAVQGGLANLQAEEGTLFSGELLVRKVPLAQRVSRARLSGTWPSSVISGEQAQHEVGASLSLAAAWLFRAQAHQPDARLSDLRAELAQGCTHGQAGRLRCTVSAENLGLAPTPWPLHSPHTINFRGPEGAHGLPVVDAARILRLVAASAIARDLGANLPVDVPADVAQALSGKVVVVGRTDEVARNLDSFVTPFAVPWPRQPDMAGVHIHAQAIDTLLSGRHLRSVGRPWTWMLSLLLVGAVVQTRRLPLRLGAGRLTDGIHGVVWLLLLAGMTWLAALVFRWTDGLALQLHLPLTAAFFTLLYVQVRAWARHDLA